MFKHTFFYELKYWLKQAATYIYGFVFFSLALLSMLGTAGFFDGGVDVPKNETVRLINSPYEINFILQYFNKFFLFLLPAIIGSTIYRDYNSKAHHILYAFPLEKGKYLAGKFLSGFVLVSSITLLVGAAFLLSELILGEENPLIGAMNLNGYVTNYLFFTLPNMLIYGVLIFVVVCTFRNIYAGFVAVLLLFLLQIITENAFIGSPYLMALFDPFGQNTLMYETNLWTLAERNTQALPVWGVVLQNRLLCLGLVTVLFFWFYRKFAFTQENPIVLWSPFSKKNKEKKSPKTTSDLSFEQLIRKPDFSWLSQVRSVLRLSNFDTKYILTSGMFLILSIFGLIAIVFAVGRVTNMGDMLLLPTTSLVLSVPMFFFSAIVILITFVFSGMLVHRANMVQMEQLVDTTAVPNWVLLTSKILALVKVQIVLLFVLIACGIGLQIFNGYTHFELGLYAYQLFVLLLPSLIIWAIFSVFVHNIFSNPYIGIFVLLMVWIGKDQLGQIGLDTYLLQFNTSPQLQYSDLNGFGHGLQGHHLVTTYWLFGTGIFAILSYLLWRRGLVDNFKTRLQLARQAFKGRVLLATLACLVPFLFLGFKIFQEENKALYSSNQSRVLTNFRANFGQYKDVIQPKIIALNLDLNIFPEQERFQGKGRYTLHNKSNKPIDTILVKTGFDEITDYQLSAANQVLSEDEKMQFRAHLLEQSLLPNDSIYLDFSLQNKPNTLFERNSTALQNGTFLRHDILPRLGYFAGHEMTLPNDSLARKKNFYALDSDNVDMTTRISTTESQIAIAPGYLQKTWTEGGRNYYEYETEQAIKFNFAFHSGVFETQKVLYKGVNLELYYHKTHNQNLSNVIDGLKSAIDYNTKYFSPYQHREARVIEFPVTEGTYSTVMANLLPTSEVRFLLNPTQDDSKIDLSFYVPAHEMTHQWWGNQVQPAATLGAKMLTESITEYISLRIYEDYYGSEKAHTFLKKQRDRYLTGRTKESSEEQALSLITSEQEYIAYGKGTMVFNAICHYIGEAELNSILQQFLLDYQFKIDIYPTTFDLIRYLQKELPNEYQYMIEDMFETITFYENRIENTSVTDVNGKYETRVDFEIKKYRAAVPTDYLSLNDFVEIGFYNAENIRFHTAQIRVNKIQNSLQFSLDEKPTKVVLDPALLMIEKEVQDNVFIIGE